MKRKIKLILAAGALAALVVTGALILPTGSVAEFALAEFSVQNMTCGSCSRKISGALAGMKGLGNIDVDVDGGRVRVEFDPSRLDPARVTDVISGAGFPSALDHVLSAAEYKDSWKKMREAHVGRIGEKLVGREEFDDEVDRLRRAMPPQHAQASAEQLQSMLWPQLVQQELLLQEARRRQVEVTDEEVAAELEQMRSSPEFARALSRFGEEEGLAKRLKSQMVIDRLLEKHILAGIDEDSHQLVLGQWFRALVEPTRVEISAPLRGGGVGPAAGGCGGDCCPKS